MDFLSRTKLCPSRCYFTFFHFPRSIALVKRLAGSPKGAEIDPKSPHANKNTQGKAHAFLYTLMKWRTKMPKDTAHS
jgi:hypothetical protein